jgi:metallopeptidase MepB
MVSRYQDMQDNMVKNVTPSRACFANVLQLWGDLAKEIDADSDMISLLRYAAADEETRAAEREASILFDTAENAWMSRRDLFLLVKAAAEKDEQPDPESHHWAKVKLREFTNAGHGSLDPATIQQYLKG